MKTSIGLKGCFKQFKGASLRVRIRESYWQLRYAWQRAWRGYDFTDVFELGFNFVERMPFLLREFKKYNDALFPNIDDNGKLPSEYKNVNELSLTEEETNAIIDEMIFYFENCNEDFVYKRLYGVDPYEDGYNHERWKVANEEMHRCWKEAMKLFSKWSMCLWY